MNARHIKTTTHSNSNPSRCRSFTVNFFSFPIHPIVTSTPAVARQWVYNLRRNHHDTLSSSSLVVGLGVQWKSPTQRYSSPSAATLQLYIDTECLIFQLCYPASAPATLRRLLADTRVTFVGVNNGRDKNVLKISRLGLEVWNIVNLAKGWGGYWSMEKMVTYLLGADDVVKPKELGLSDWEKFWLTNDQVQYACVDALVSFLLATQALGYPKHDHVYWLTTDDDDNGADFVVHDRPVFTWYSDDDNGGGGDFIVDDRPVFTWYSDDGDVMVDERPVFAWYIDDDDGGDVNVEERPAFTCYSDDDDGGDVNVDERPVFTWYSDDDDGDGGGGGTVEARPVFTWYNDDDVGGDVNGG